MFKILAGNIDTVEFCVPKERQDEILGQFDDLIEQLKKDSKETDVPNFYYYRSVFTNIVYQHRLSSDHERLNKTEHLWMLKIMREKMGYSKNRFEKVFHGTFNYFEETRPTVCDHGYSYFYASSDIGFAAYFLSRNRGSDRVSVGHYEKKGVVFEERYKGALAESYGLKEGEDNTCYMYEFPGKYFLYNIVHCPNELVSEKPISDFVRTQVTNPLDYILELAAKKALTIEYFDDTLSTEDRILKDQDILRNTIGSNNEVKIQFVKERFPHLVNPETGDFIKPLKTPLQLKP
jgi:hypothetical protein